MKNIKIVLFSLFFMFSSLCIANDEKTNILLEQINQVENTLRSDNEFLEERVKSLESRLSKLSIELADVQSLREEIESKYQSILRKEASFSSISEDITANKSSISSIKTDIINMKTNQVRLEGDIDSSQKIVTWVTLIVSVVVVLIGAFFSRSFLELYSNYRVVCARYPEAREAEKDA
ncbi:MULTISPECIES: hypothetical protein [unclassified Vibrio]|uniref:hypothetical protein n=1 Tax=unclassified Vibrio TaxID=2614977 RepID=UPI00354BCB23